MEADAADPSTFTSDLELVAADTGTSAATAAALDDDHGLSTAAIVAICVGGLALAGVLFRIVRRAT